MHEVSRQNNIIRITPEAKNAPKLAPGNYVLGDDKYGFYLEDYEDFSLPSKIYGEQLEPLTNRVLSTFERTQQNVGILLAGLKGTGKSLQMKHIAKSSGMPTIMINKPYPGGELLPFLNTIPNGSVIVFDEFAKVYRKTDAQESILPLLDGLSTQPHIYILTINECVSTFFLGRPSRLRYHKNYKSIQPAVYYQILEEKIENPEHVEKAKSFFDASSRVNMDSLLELSNELNHWSEDSFEDILSIFNMDDPLNEEFDMYINVPALVVDKGFDKKPVYDYVKEKYETSQVGGPSSAEEMRASFAIMKDVVKKFPEVKIKNFAYHHNIENLREFLEEGDFSELYCRKSYKNDIDMHEECLFHMGNSEYLDLDPTSIEFCKDGRDYSLIKSDIMNVTISRALRTPFNSVRY